LKIIKSQCFYRKTAEYIFPTIPPKPKRAKMYASPHFRGIKKVSGENILAYLYFFKLFLCGSAYRACICTSTAVNALICIYFILAVAFADSLNRTLSSTSAA
jgi:hypothetical protein